MKKVKFIKDSYIDGELVFKVGQVYELDEKSGSYDRWIRRGCAEDFNGPEVEEEKQVVETPEKKMETTPEQRHKPRNGKHKPNKPHAYVDDL